MSTRSDEHERRYRCVRGVINRHDPAKLLDLKSFSWIDGEWRPFDRAVDDEYDSEVKGVLSVLKSAQSERELRDRIERLFETMLSGESCRGADWGAIAMELWKASRQPSW